MDGWQRSRGGLTTTKTAPVAVAVGVAVVLLGGWAGQQIFALGETSVTCVSWAGVPDDESREKAASIVLDGRVLGASGQRPMFGERATVWEVEVVAVVKGEQTVGEVVEVASTPQTCSGATYPDGDPLARADGTVRLYLHDSDFAISGTETGLALISPFDGIGTPR